MGLLPFVIAGLVSGSVYGLTATGLVLTYKTSGVFNFSHGAVATVGAYVFFTLHVTHEIHWGPAALISVVGVGLVLGLALELVGRQLAGASLVTKVAATIGVLLTIQALVQLGYPSGETRTIPQYLPSGSFEVDGTRIGWDQVAIVATASVATAVLSVFFRVARLGVAMRGVVDGPELVDLCGTSPTKVRRWAWVIGASFAAASGVMLAPLLAELKPVNLTFLVVTAFGAAAVGRFTSLPLTFAGGLVIGVAQQLVAKYVTEGFWSGLAPAMPFVVLFGLLLFSRGRAAAETMTVTRRPSATRRVHPLLQAATAASIVVVLLFVPRFAELQLTEMTRALAYVVVFLSLGLLVHTSGQVSLAHVSFMAIGVCAMAHLTVDRGLPWGLALMLSGLIAVPVGALLAIPAIRLSGLYLALATFGFGVLLQYMFYTEKYMFGGFGLGLTIPRPAPGGNEMSSEAFYYLVLAIAAVACAAVVALNGSRLGRLLRGLTDSPTAMTTSGASVNITRVLVFCISAFLAGVGGALDGAASGYATGDGYQPISSLLLFAVVVICARTAPWYALMAAFGLIVVPLIPFDFLAGDHVQDWLTLLFGLAALSTAFTSAVPDRLFSRWPASLRLPHGDRGKARAGRPASRPAAIRELLPEGSLAVENLQVRFGGVTAVDGVTIKCGTGRVTGLIGPNGAGKTTTFNACSGLVRPANGRVLIDGRSVASLGPAGRARRGVGRTFQQMELFEGQTVRENVALGAEASRAGLNPLTHLIGSRRQRREDTAATNHALYLCGLDELAERTVSDLSTGQRRLVELARVLAGRFHFLLLDEPSSGLDRVETERFGEILKQVVAERSIGILIVEHDMALVSSVCDYVHVLDFGKPIFEGSIEQMLTSAVVRAAYLGDAEVERASDEPNGPDRDRPEVKVL